MPDRAASTHVHLVHALPGRLRLRLAPAPDTVTSTHLRARMAAGHGVRQVHAGRWSGSLLVIYDAVLTDPERIVALLGQTFDRRRYAERPVGAPESDHGDAAVINAPSVGLLDRLAFPGMLLRAFLPPWWRMLFAFRRAWPFLGKGWGALRRGSLSIDLLDGLSIGISLLRRDLRSVMILTTLLSIGEFLEQWTRKRSRDQLVRDLLHLPDQVWVKHNGVEAAVALNRVRPGDAVVVRTGGRIPVDGVVAEGEAMVNQAGLTGEPLAVAKGPGISVFAGTVVEEGTLVIQATQVGDATRVVKVLKMLETSERVKAGLQSRAERWADRAVPVTLGLALLTYLLTRNLNRAVAVLLVDFSCAIKLSTPLTMLAAMREASTKGVLIKGGRFLEKLEQADTYVFDKTGTLTAAAPRAMEVIGFNNHAPREVLRIAACLEEHFPHPLARAVVAMAEREGLSHREEHADLEYILAHGIASRLNGHRVLVGSRHFVQAHGRIDLNAARESMEMAARRGRSMLFVGIGPHLAGIILLEDPIRPDAGPFLRRLRHSGVRHIEMLTGDGDESAAEVARVLEIDAFGAQLLPEDKARRVKALRRDGRVVAMVGDGINDTPALSAADVGIAMRSGADLAHEVCDVLLTRAELEGILIAGAIARRAMSRLRWNYATVMGINGGLMLLGLAGRISPAASALLHNLVTVLVTANSLRPFEGAAGPQSMEPAP